MIALGLSGGGGRIGYHVGALKALYDRGLRPQVIAGSSSGALVGAFLAQGRTPLELEEILLELDADDVHRTYPLAWVLARFALRELGAYDLSPLRRTVARVLGDRPFVLPFHAGYVDLESREFRAPDLRQERDRRRVIDIIVASCTMPIIWPPSMVDGRPAYDGGVRWVNPIATLLDYQPDVLVLSYCQARDLGPASQPRSILDVAQWLLDALVHDNLMGDFARFRDRNWAAAQYEARVGEPLEGPGGKRWKRYDAIVIQEPAPTPGDSLTFERAQFERDIAAGYSRASAELEGRLG